MRNASLGIAAVLAVLLAGLATWILLRSQRRPEPSPPPPPPTPSPEERRRVVERLTAAAQRDPDALARAIAALMEQP